MIVVESLADGDTTKTLSPSKEALAKFETYLYEEITDAFSARAAAQERVWITALKDYEAKPDNETTNIPIQDAPNLIVPLGAIASESIYSIAIDLIFNTSPPVTVRAQNNENAKAIQILVDRITNSPDVQLRSATENAILDCINLGTGLLYIPFVEATKKTDLKRVKFFGPRIFAVPPEDVITRGGSMTSNIDLLPWFGFRTFINEYELGVRGKKLGWDISKAQACGAVDQVRIARETLAKTSETGKRARKLYEILDIYSCYDIDEDGEPEDLLVFYDRTSRKILKLGYNPYERIAFTKMCYQIRAHQFYGMGVPEMLRQMQTEITMVHNHRTLNLMLANVRMWISKPGTFPSGNVLVWPNRNIESNNPEDVKELKLSDVYPSAAMAEAGTIQLAERRVGSELPLPRPSQIMSSRTPATTTMTMLQQVNRRFAPAFDQMRQAVGGAIKHCLYRISEQLQSGNLDVEEWVKRLFGDDPKNVALAQTAIGLLKDVAFDDEVDVELTASSATVNRDVDKNNMMTMVNILIQYYQRILELSQVASNTKLPPPVQDMAKQIITKASEVLDRVMRTFDNVRDPQTLIVTLNENLDQAMPGADPQALAALQAVSGMVPNRPGAGGFGPNGGAPQ